MGLRNCNDGVVLAGDAIIRYHDRVLAARVRRSRSRLRAQLVGMILAVLSQIKTTATLIYYTQLSIVHAHSHTRGHWTRGSSSRGSHVVKTWPLSHWDAFRLT